MAGTDARPTRVNGEPLFMSSSLKELYASRLREFYRQPARIFWVYGFPLILAIGLGTAFSNPAQVTVSVDVTRTYSPGPLAKLITDTSLLALSEKKQSLSRIKIPNHPELLVTLVDPEEGLKRVNTGKSSLLVSVTPSGEVDYRFDPTRPESEAAKATFDDALQAANGRPNPVLTKDNRVSEKGSRYIDFLIPGLIGQNTMGGGLWGVGFLIVNFRIAKLLKRFMATPMPRRNFLIAILGARLTFLIPDVGVLLALGYFKFDMPIRGSFALIMLLELLGALAFAGIGLLIASRAKTTETVSGLMNLVMLPMWIFSGLFFSADRFAEGPAHWFSQALPLTHLLSGLRAVILNGATIGESVVWIPLLVLFAWASITFTLALKLFRWT